MRCGKATTLLAAMSMIGTAIAGEADWSGFVSIEPRIFFEAPAFPEQTDKGISPSAVIAPEFRYVWRDGDDRLTLVPFVRLDADDDERTHADLREASWLHLADPWTLRVGLSKVFWGVTEARHLVDIINQTDLVEDIDEEDKLGQPMIQLERWTEAGTIGLFLLPYFRERTFPADDARLRGPLPIATDGAVYESGAKERRIDAAVRWSQATGNWDLGLSLFHGTAREPRLVPMLEPPARLVLVPHYDVISQLGVDVQYTHEAWLWKLEAIGRSGHGKSFGALVAGFEYTFFGLRESGADLRVLIEYLYDDRDDSAPATVLDDDIFAGLRIALNDPDDTSILVGIITDRNDRAVFGFIEAERRFADRWKLEFEVRLFSNIPSDDLVAGIREDSFATLRLARFF